MGNVLTNLEAIRGLRLTDVGDDSDLARLKNNGPRALPNTPSANDWTAPAILRKLYAPSEILFAYMKKYFDASAETFSQIDGLFAATAGMFHLGTEVVGFVEIEEDD